jgi:hypothetical protein
VPHDVLDDDDRIVDQDADREDEGEERDAVQRVAVQVEHEQRQRERHRNGDQDHERLAPAKGQPDEHGDGDDRDKHVPQELVRLVRRGLAVVARDRDLHIARKEVAAHGLHLALDFARQLDGVHALALCDRQRDGRKGLPAPGMVLDVVSRLPAAVHDRGDIFQADRRVAG